MRICLVGGIFDKDHAYRQRVRATPETTLLSGLRAGGHDVVAQGHHDAPAFDGFDVVHVHHLSWAAVAAAARTGAARFVYTHHGMASAPVARRLVCGWVMRAADAVVALSSAEADWQRQSLRVPAARQHVIPNGVDEQLFSASCCPPASPGAPWRLLYVGQLIELKGLPFLLQACARLAGRHSLSLRLAYHVDSDLPALREQARRLGVQVEFLGVQTPEQLARLYADSHIVVLPSLSEALPSVISEAMMVGRPIVATAVGGVPDQLAGLGRLVAPGDVASLVEGLADVLTDYPGWSGRGGAMSESARARFSTATMISRHEELYRALCAQPWRPATSSALQPLIRAATRVAARARRPAHA